MTQTFLSNNYSRIYKFVSRNFHIRMITHNITHFAQKYQITTYFDVDKTIMML